MADVADDESGPRRQSAFLQARLANEILKAQAAKVRLRQMTGELMTRSQAMAFVHDIGRRERKAMQDLPALIAPVLAADFNIDAAAVEASLRDLIDGFLRSRAAALKSK